MTKKPNITGIHHIAIKCGSMELYEKTMHFYHDILGLPIARTWGEGENIAAMVDTGAGMLEIFAKATDTPSVGVVRHFAFDVEDTDACYEAVIAAGYESIMAPKDLVIASEPPYPARIAFCRGPLGEEVEFFHVK